MALAPISDLTPYHDRLNPRLWRGNRLRIGVRIKLMQTAVAFYRFLDVPQLRVDDILLTGSNAAYNYTQLSDIDLHLLVRYDETSCPALAGNFFTTKKSLWNQTYDIVIYDHDVELYVEDARDPVRATGVYSVLHDKWLKIPSDTPPERNDTAVLAKAEAYADEIESLLVGEPKIEEITDLLSRLHTLRQNGLLSGGEFSVENLAYKTLRNLGFLQRLYDKRIEIRDRSLSL